LCPAGLSLGAFDSSARSSLDLDRLLLRNYPRNHGRAAIELAAAWQGDTGDDRHRERSLACPASRSAGIAGAIGLLLPGTAFAHTGIGVLGGFSSGFQHPIFGWDHLLAMVAVGMWGAQLGMPLIWVLPVTFPLVMALSGMLGGMGMPLPGVEIGIAASVLVLGLMLALAARPPIWIAAMVVGTFAVFHGYAHGAELPEAADPIAYGLGFVLATGLLHLTGIVIGLMIRWPVGQQALRVGGLAIALAGLWLLVEPMMA
jgi:urease accessory protein